MQDICQQTLKMTDQNWGDINFVTVLIGQCWITTALLLTRDLWTMVSAPLVTLISHLNLQISVSHFMWPCEYIVPLQLAHHSCQRGGRSGWGSETGRRDLSVTLGTPPSPSGRLREGEREGLIDWWPIGYTYVTVLWRNQSLNTIYHQRSMFCQSDLVRVLIETSHLKMFDSLLESGITIHSKNVSSWDIELTCFQLGVDHSQVWP